LPYGGDDDQAVPRQGTDRQGAFYIALERLDAEADLLAIVGSYGSRTDQPADVARIKSVLMATPASDLSN